MSKWASLVLLVFLYIGIDALFGNVITGTTQGEIVARTFFPFIIAAVIAVFLTKLFR